MESNISPEQIHRDNLDNCYKYLSGIRTREDEAIKQMEQAAKFNDPTLTAETALLYIVTKLDRVEAELSLAKYELEHSQKELNITKAKLLLAEEKANRT